MYKAITTAATKWFILLAILSISTISKSFSQSNTELSIYKDINKPVEERVIDLLSKMTLEEKVELVGGDGFNTKKNIRLGIPEILMADGPQGPNTYGRSTHYSAMINLAATFNTDLMYEVASNMGKETRVFNGQTYVMEFAIKADYSLVKCNVADRYGNLTYNKTARNFGPIMCTAAKTTIVQTKKIVEPGEIDPEIVVTPGIFVTKVVEVTNPEAESKLVAEDRRYPCQ